MNGSGKPPLKPPGVTNRRGAALDGSADHGPRARKESDGAITSAEVTPSASAWASLGRAVEWVCTSTRPGITHRPVASRTVACGGIGTLLSGPTVTILSPRMTIVIRSRGEALMPSITVAEAFVEPIRGGRAEWACVWLRTQYGLPSVVSAN